MNGFPRILRHLRKAFNMKERDQGKQGQGRRRNDNPRGTYSLRNKEELEGKKIIVILQDIGVDIAS